MKSSVGFKDAGVAQMAEHRFREAGVVGSNPTPSLGQEMSHGYVNKCCLTEVYNLFVSKLINLAGERFGRLLILKRVGAASSGDVIWLCMCDCGNNTAATGFSIRSGDTRSCGCLRKETTIKRSTKHGHSKRGKQTKIYRSWYHMVQRCINSNDRAYPDYGGRGITVCQRWTKFSNFLEDVPGWKPGLTIERIKNNKGYYPNNCRWATKKEQSRNKRNNRWATCFGKTQLLIEWSEEMGIPYRTLWYRIAKSCWSIEKSLTTPAGRKRKI